MLHFIQTIQDHYFSKNIILSLSIIIIFFKFYFLDLRTLLLVMLKSHIANQLQNRDCIGGAKTINFGFSTIVHS